VPATVGEVYTRLLEGFTGGVSELQHVRHEALRGVQERVNAIVREPNGDIMTYAGAARRITLSPLQNEGDFENRGRQALQMQELYGLSEPRPLTADEVRRIGHTVRVGTFDEQTRVLALLQRLGPRAASGAYRQLGETDEVFAHVAGLATTGDGGMSIAQEILRGRARMRDNPDIRHVLTTAPGGIDNQFNQLVGQSLDFADPRARQAIQQAATALYVDRLASGQTTFDARQYAQAVAAVLGARGPRGGIGTVNGATMLLPVGVSAVDLDAALERLTYEDLRTLSVSGQPPRWRTAEPPRTVQVRGGLDWRGNPLPATSTVTIDPAAVRPDQIAGEARFRAIGADTYNIVGVDGLPMATADGTPYRMRLDARAVSGLLSRPQGGPGFIAQTASAVWTRLNTPAARISTPRDDAWHEYLKRLNAPPAN